MWFSFPDKSDLIAVTIGAVGFQSSFILIRFNGPSAWVRRTRTYFFPYGLCKQQTPIFVPLFNAEIIGYHFKENILDD